jgi:hypothetical protein
LRQQRKRRPAVRKEHVRAKGSLEIQGEIFQRHRALLPHVGNCIGTVAFTSKAGVRVLKLE